MSFFSDIVVPIMVIVAMAVAIIVACMGAMMAFSYYDCMGFERATGTESRFEAMTCYVSKDDHFITMEEYRQAYTTKQELKVEVK